MTNRIVERTTGIIKRILLKREGALSDNGKQKSRYCSCSVAGTNQS